MSHDAVKGLQNWADKQNNGYTRAILKAFYIQLPVRPSDPQIGKFSKGALVTREASIDEGEWSWKNSQVNYFHPLLDNKVKFYWTERLPFLQRRWFG